MIEQSPAELERRYGLTFERGVDSLDEYLLAAVEDPELGQLVLFRHVQAPFHGTEVMVDVAERTSRALCAIESTLGIQQRQLSWIAEDEVDARLEFILAHRASRLASRG